VPQDPRAKAAERLASVVEPALIPLGFVRSGAVLNRRLDGGLVQAFQVTPSKWISDQWVVLDLGVYSSDVGSILKWSQPDRVVELADCHVRDRLPRRTWIFREQRWPRARCRP